MGNIKDSGIEWIGKIPKNWNVKIIKNICKLKGRIGWEGLTSDEYIDEGPYLITGIDFLEGHINWENCVHVSEWRYNQAKEIQIKDNDLLITKDGTVGKVALTTNTPQKATLNSGVLLMRPIGADYKEKFLYYVLLSEEFWHWFELENLGNTTIVHLYQNAFAKFKLALPNLEEQQAIADCLDDKVGKIDDILADLNKQVEILTAYKKSLITETVTKGLNPDATMKDSGIEWIGEVPTHWDIKRLRYICNLKTGGTPTDRYGINDDKYGYPWVTAPDINNTYKINEFSQYISNDAIRESAYKLFPEKTILLVCIASVGKIGIINEKCYSNQQITALMAKNNIHPEYLLYFMISCSDNIVADASSNVVPIINSSYLKDIKCTFPSEKEQITIANYLDKKCSQVDSLIADKQTQIEKMKKYKKSLIYEYVTGKKRVKEVV